MLFTRATAELMINDDDDDLKTLNMFLSDTKKLASKIFEFTHKRMTNNTHNNKKTVLQNTHKKPTTDGRKHTRE